jgi:hypothetical protein
MAKRILNWLATETDLRKISADLSEALDLRYIDASFQTNKKERSEFASIAEIPGCGLAPTGEKVSQTAYCLVGPDTRIYHGKMKIEPGRVDWYLDVERMPDAVQIQLPGIHQPSRTLITGEVAAWSSSPLAETYMRTILRTLKKTCTRRGNGLIGAHAWELAQDGWRCRFSIQSPREYDIALE